MSATDASIPLDQDPVRAELEVAADELEQAASRLLECEVRVAYLDSVLEALLGTLDALLVAVDGGGTVAAVSEVVCDISGLTPARAIGRPVEVVARHAGIVDVVPLVERVISGEVREQETTIEGWDVRVSALPGGTEGALVFGRRPS